VKACGCEGACTARCRNDRSALHRAAALRRNGHTAPLAVRPQAQRRPLKPSAALVLHRLLLGPASNRELMNLAGFGWACRISEVRAVGHDIRCERLGPTPGMRTYTLDAPVRGGEGVAIGDPPPGADVLATS